MSTDPNDRAAVEKRLWKELDDARFGMLGLVDAREHFQPMTIFIEPEHDLIWFFTHDDTDLAKRAKGGAEAMLVVQSKDHDFHACIGGALSLARDSARIERYWSATVGAWFPEGKDDPRLTLLRLDARDAAVWISKAGPVRFAWEVAKANLTDSPPEISDTAHVRFS
ncbi:pyridoxamine 5'-phosphate oxidase family protein [Caulobacter sp. LjRoot300]|uniref:pyridoxamine 5'-phosphate oxidase family protein n=1 Tax=Caulobacter sp. LjRoot300 TaxID=3342321 RepID=UPI003ECE266C